MTDAKAQLNMSPKEIRLFFLGMQEKLYNGERVVNVNIHNHYHGPIDNLNIQGS